MKILGEKYTKNELEGESVDMMIEAYGLMAQTGRKILGMAVKAKEAADAGKSAE